MNLPTWIFPCSNVFSKMLKSFAKICRSNLNILLGKCIICCLVLFWDIWKTNATNERTNERKSKRAQVKKNNTANQQNERVFPPFFTWKGNAFVRRINRWFKLHTTFFALIFCWAQFFLALWRRHSERSEVVFFCFNVTMLTHSLWVHRLVANFNSSSTTLLTSAELCICKYNYTDQLDSTETLDSNIYIWCVYACVMISAWSAFHIVDLTWFRLHAKI